MKHPRLAYLGHVERRGDEAELARTARAAEGFVEAGADLRLVLRRSGRTSARDRLERTTGVILPDVMEVFAPRIGPFLLPYYWRTYRRLARSDRNVVLFRDPDFLPWAIRLRRRDMRVFFEAHAYWCVPPAAEEAGPASSRRARRFERRLAGVDGVFCTSAPLVELYRRRFPGLAVESALTGTRFPRPVERDGFSRLLGYLGSLDDRHPVEAVVAGLARCRTAAARLLVVGARDEAERSRLEARAEQLGIGDRVEIHGWVLPDELEQHVERIDVGVVPLSDTFEARTVTPLKLVDYLSRALPTIATRTPAVTAYVTHGREALLVDGSADSWAAAIDRLYADFDDYRALSNQALARARELTWTQRAVRMLDRIQEAL